MKMTSKRFILNLEEEVQVGELKATLVAQVMGDKKLFDIEFIDIENISYMGIEINGYDSWKKFREFHKGMGIDFNAHLDKKFEEIFTKESIEQIVKDLKF